MSEYVIEIPSIDVDDGATVYYPDERHDPMPIEPLVRCRDCKYYEPNTYSHFTCELLTFYVEPDGFCKWGEPREEA